jgi:multiple sugar transport system permease protein/raffinose/stachyose/melibiose transport system permease protein
MKSNRFVASVLIPAFALLTLFLILPIIGSFVFSLFDYNPLRSSNIFLGLDNYKRLFGEEIYRISLRNTLIFVLSAATINIALALVLANFISGMRHKWLRNIILVCIFLPCVAPIANSAVVWARSIFSNRTGLFNMIITALGGEPVSWLSSHQMVMPSIVLFTVWADVGYNTILLTAGVDNIPHEFYESAHIDGAGFFQRFFRITVPLLGRIMMLVIPMTLSSHFQMFAQFELLARNGGPSRAGQVLTTYIYYAGFRAKDLGYASAISVTLFLLIFTVTMIQRRLSRVDWEY